MLGNFLEETCTGTGGTLALAGATTDNIAFQEKFADGDLVSYVLIDSGGTIKVGGIGAYVSATDDITRQDTWNWNGTVYDDSPSTNITLGGGTHTVRCDALSDGIGNGGVTSARIQMPDTFNEISASFSISGGDRMLYVPFPLRYSGAFDAFAFEVTAVGGGGNVRCGLYSSKNGQPDVLLAVHDTSFSVGTTGLKSASFDGGALNLKSSDYFIALHNDDSLNVRGANSDSVLANMLGSTAMNAPIANLRENRTYAAMPDPAEITTQVYNTAGIIMGLDAV